jgi:acyl-coenzyme A synthetase/AMP-(fatty) acid ligase
MEIGTDSLPKTSTGKVDRKRVLAQLEEMTHANG